jgi:hypothetical protein
MRNCGKAVLIIIFYSLLFSSILNAQKYRMDLNNITLSEALIDVSKQFDFKVAYNAQKLSTIKINRIYIREYFR